MNKTTLWRLMGLGIALVTIMADQLSKFAIMTGVFDNMYGESVPSFVAWLTEKGERLLHPPIRLTEFFNLVMVWNPGVSFGMLQSGGDAISYLLSGFAVLVALCFLVWMWREPRPSLAIPIGMVAGGALGNVWDRVRYGAVIDFLDVHVDDLHWPAFNVADAAITVGVILLVADQVFLSKHAQRGAV